jgi:hypothetical protein
MSPIDPIIQYATQHLGGRTVPDDLRKLLNLQWRDAAGGSSANLFDPKKTGKPFFVWYNPARMHVTILLLLGINSVCGTLQELEAVLRSIAARGRRLD